MQGLKKYLGFRWILLHLLILALVAVMINLGFWQLRRLDTRQGNNSRVLERSEQTIQADSLLNSGKSDLEYYNLEISGSYRQDLESIVRNRTMDGRPGVWVLTPFVSSDTDQVFVVNRGWVPRELSSPACRPEGGEEAEGLEAPNGEVSIKAILRKDKITETDWEKCLSRVNTGAFADEFPDSDVSIYWLQLTERETGEGANPSEGPIILDSPNLGEGPHLAYAVQWFIFSSILAVGYVVVLYRKLYDNKQT